MVLKEGYKKQFSSLEKSETKLLSHPRFLTCLSQFSCSLDLWCRSSPQQWRMMISPSLCLSHRLAPSVNYRLSLPPSLLHLILLSIRAAISPCRSIYLFPFSQIKLLEGTNTRDLEIKNPKITKLWYPQLQTNSYYYDFKSQIWRFYCNSICRFFLKQSKNMNYWSAMVLASWYIRTGTHYLQSGDLDPKSYILLCMEQFLIRLVTVLIAAKCNIVAYNPNSHLRVGHVSCVLHDLFIIWIALVKL